MTSCFGDDTKPGFSLEFFPPKTEIGYRNLLLRIKRLALLGPPRFVSITFGASGATASQSLALAKACIDENLTTVLHLTCTNMPKSIIDDTLENAKKIGVKYILALRGDAPRISEYSSTSNNNNNNNNTDIINPKSKENQFFYAIDLVKYIRKKYGSYFKIGVAAYPEGHTDSSSPEIQDPEYDLPFLIEKVKAGADFILCQLCFDSSTIVNYISKLKSHPSNVFKSIPIIPGILPIYTYQYFQRTIALTNAKVPTDLKNLLNSVAKGDDSEIKKVGVDYLVNLINNVYQNSNKQISLFHFYTLNLEKSIALILEKCPVFKDTTPSSLSPRASPLLEPRRSSIASSSLNSTSIPITTLTIDDQNPRQVALTVATGQGPLGRDATWDDFPNGRYGDSRSPAFALTGSGGTTTIDIYSSATAVDSQQGTIQNISDSDGVITLARVSPQRAIELWGRPSSAKDITNLFLSHLSSSPSAVPMLPWSDSEAGLNSETDEILPQLRALNSKGYWTIASQPAVNGAHSNDPIFGWGPQESSACSYVFQKAFVELFISYDEFINVLKPKLDKLSSNTVSYFATSPSLTPHYALIQNHPNKTYSNPNFSTALNKDLEAQESQNSNAVTWGIFPNREVIQPTIIEAVSFSAWAQDAFGIWSQWMNIHPKSSESYQLLKNISSTYYFVTIIHHNYVDEPMGLWDILLND